MHVWLNELILAFFLTFLSCQVFLQGITRLTSIKSLLRCHLLRATFPDPFRSAPEHLAFFFFQEPSHLDFPQLLMNCKLHKGKDFAFFIG